MNAARILIEYLHDSLNEQMAKGVDAMCKSVRIELKIAARCQVIVNFDGVPKFYLNKSIVERLVRTFKREFSNAFSDFSTSSRA
jgi:hypothetical protein